MNNLHRLSLFLACSTVLLWAQAPPQPAPQPEFVKQGQQFIRDGKPEQALALYRKTLDASPDSFAALIATGSVLDLMGQTSEARTYFEKAMQTADTPEHKVAAQRATAISYAFERNCGKAVEFEQLVFDYYGTTKNFFQQGEIANETGRICLDAGDLNLAKQWYELGHDTGLKEPDIKPARRDLWDFRWEHAQARLAARAQDPAGAQQHMASAKAILDKGTNPEQAQFFPYLQAYVAFYTGDYKSALENFEKSNQNDPFIQCMTAETYDKLGQREKALELYRKAMLASSHNPTAAYAVPFSRKALS